MAESMLDSEILDGFKEESKQIFDELIGIVEQLEARHDSFPSKLLEDYSQRIDRIMGTAKTLNMMAPDHQGLKRIGGIAELCKKTGYKASEAKTQSLIPIFAAFWADTIEVLQELVDVVDQEEKSAELAKSFAAVLQRRLEWLSSKLLKPADTVDINQLIKDLMG